MKLRFLSTSALALILPGLAQAQDVTLIVNCFMPPQHFLCSQLLPGWLADVEAATGGRVSGLVLPTSAAPPPDQLAATEAGQVDVAVQFNGLIPGDTVGARVAMVPFSGSDSAERNSAALWATTRAFFPDEFPNVELLSQFVISPVQLYSLGDQPLESLADLESRRVWALPGPLAAIGSAIGAGVVSTPAVESRDILSRGVVDASIGPEPHSVENMQLTGYIRSLTSFERPLYTSSFSMMMNSGTWGRISPEDQEAIRGVSGEVFARRAGAAWDAANVEVLQHFADAGVVTVRADAAFNADMQQSAAFLNDAWLAEAAAAGGDGAAALAFYRAAVED
ncbi:MAG: hypothetical protein H6898_06830 [Rhodobacter sp.]|nr:hypothetical protein [Paracoccaceae bacterium]MCC0076288.1 hypothetical protein [Rhodobacter sp.]